MQINTEEQPLSLKELSNRLRDKRLKLVAKRTGLHYNTLRKIRDDDEANPTLNVMLVLSNYLKNQ